MISESKVRLHRAVVLICQKTTQKARVHSELKLASVLSDYKKGFSKYVNSKRKFLNIAEDGHLTNG